MREVLGIPAGNTSYVHYNIVVAKPLVLINPRNEAKQVDIRMRKDFGSKMYKLS